MKILVFWVVMILMVSAAAIVIVNCGLEEQKLEAMR
jgi:hypothetical protein